MGVPFSEVFLYLYHREWRGGRGGFCDKMQDYLLLLYCVTAGKTEKLIYMKERSEYFTNAYILARTRSGARLNAKS